MNVRETLRRLSGIMILAFVLAMTTGCNKMLANFSLNQANKRVAEAEANKAEQFTKPDLDTTKAAIAETDGMIAGQDFKGARLKAKEAATLAKALLIQTKTLRADFLKNEANKWLGIAKTNNAELEDAARYQETIKLNADGEAAHLKKKWDKAIENFDRTVNNVQVILQNLKRQAEQGLNDVKKQKEELIAVEAPEHFPEGITEIDDFILRIEAYITEKYEYRTAISTAEVAVQNAKKAATKSKEVKSNKILTKIEGALSRAVTLGAQIYAIDNYNGVSADFEEASKQFYNGNYDTVLTTGPPLLVRAEDLIVETQRESARARMNAVEKAINDLTAGKAKQYLPGRVEEMEEVLVRAKALFDQAKYPETEEEAKKGLEKEKKLVDDFDALAKKHWNEADSAIKVTEGIFGRMQEIFARPSPIVLTGDEKVFQDRKVAMREELSGRLANAKNDLTAAEQNRVNKEFAITIETSDRLVTEGADIVNGTYRVVSFDAIQELTNLLSVYEREGAREYATLDINEAQDLLDATREAHNRGDYRQALDRGASTHAKLEDTLQSLERHAIKTKLEAEKLLGEAKAQRADEFQEGKVAQIGSMIREANDLLNDPQLKRSIITAEEAIKLAESTKTESAKLWAEEEMRRTDLLLARADQAGAAGYAPDQLGEARDLRTNAQSLYDSGDYPQAQITGAQAAEAAERTLFAPVIKAEDEIAAAKRFNGWRHEWQRLSESMVNASYAREFMEQGKYAQALQHAAMSSQVASAVVVDAKRAEFYDRLNSLNGKVETAMSKGAGFYQVKDLSKVVGELNAVAKEFQPGGYEEAAEKIEQLEAQLGGLVEMTPNVLNDLVKQMNDSLASLEERGAKISSPDLVAEATRKIKYAQLDFKSEQYRQSFQNAKDALSILQEIDLKLLERDYDLKLSEHFTQLSRIMQEFSAVLNAGSPVILQMIKGTNGRPQALSIANASDPTQFRQDVVDLTAQVKLLEPPATRRGVHDASLKMLDQVREGATGFEKMLILDQYNYDDARQIIEKSFLQIRSARGRQQEIQRSLANPQTQSEQRGVKRAMELGGGR